MPDCHCQAGPDVTLDERNAPTCSTCGAELPGSQYVRLGP